MEISSQEKILIEIVRILDNLKINYFITGGFAVSVWGRPRATFDIDIAVMIAEAHADKLAKAWKGISRAGYADAYMVKDAIRNGGYAVIKKPFDIDTIVNMIEKSRKGALLAVVDDDPNIVKTMKNVLERKGFSITTAPTGEEAIALAKDRPRDIFFIDMKLPVLNGLETYMEIRKVNPEAVVVMMTAYQQEMDELVRQALEKGAYSCIYKPFDMDEVIRIVEEVSKKKQK